MSRSYQIQRCIDGHAIRPSRQHHASVLGGNCWVCDRGPLHPSRPGVASACGCSFVRGGKLVCRPCAIAFDYVRTGSSKITGGPEPQLFAYCISLWRRGERAQRMIYDAATPQEGTS